MTPQRRKALLTEATRLHHELHTLGRYFRSVGHRTATVHVVAHAVLEGNDVDLPGVHRALANEWFHNRAGSKSPCRERWVPPGSVCAVCGRTRFVQRRRA